MGQQTEIWTFVLQVCFAVVGLISNGYITILNAKVLIKVRRLSMWENLVTTLSFTNLCLQITMAFNDIWAFYWPQFYILERIAKPFFVTGLFLVSSSLWISTWLCVYRSMKITNSQHKIILWLQKHMPTIVPVLIIGSVLLAMVQSFSGINDLFVVYRNMSSYQDNVSKIAVGFGSRCFCTIWLYVEFSSEAFILFLLATLTILSFLWKHVRNVKRGTNIRGNQQLYKIFQAARTVTLLLLLCVTFYVAQCLLYTNVAAYGTLLNTISLLLISMFPALNAVILITGNQKLKQPLIEISKRWFSVCNNIV
ncbi:taste receptor type 2 member 119-like [Pelobates fuscus]|uniref:taste receptor type 2 member 119-like n=1 Tax=Pelobates fuscus TaxID=191477 RepID=UPI002FE4A449